VRDGVAADFVGNSRRYSQTLARLEVNLMPTAPILSGILMARMSDISRRLNLLKQHVFATPLARRQVILSLLTCLCLMTILGCMRIWRGPGGPGQMAFKDAVEILTTHAIHDAVIPTSNGAWHCSPALADLDGMVNSKSLSGTWSGITMAIPWRGGLRQMVVGHPPLPWVMLTGMANWKWRPPASCGERMAA
jgi:hypothetical protein